MSVIIEEFEVKPRPRKYQGWIETKFGIISLEKRATEDEAQGDIDGALANMKRGLAIDAGVANA